MLVRLYLLDILGHLRREHKLNEAPHGVCVDSMNLYVAVRLFAPLIPIKHDSSTSTTRFQTQFVHNRGSCCEMQMKLKLERKP